MGKKLAGLLSIGMLYRAQDPDLLSEQCEKILFTVHIVKNSEKQCNDHQGLDKGCLVPLSLTPTTDSSGNSSGSTFSIYLSNSPTLSPPGTNYNLLPELLR